MGKDLRFTTALSLAALFSIGAGASASREPELDNAAISWQAITSRIEAGGAEDRRITAALLNWRSLTSTNSAGFAGVSSFLIANPGWPDEARLRTLAEQSADVDRDGAAPIVLFFGKFAPRTAQAKATNAFALARLGRMDDAKAAARDAWVAGPLPLLTEQRLLASFSSSLTPTDHLRHADAVLWRRSPDAAERVLSYLPATRQPVVAARIAFQRKSPDAALKMGAADPVGVMDAGYLTDKANWLAASGNGLAARQLLAERMPLSQTPADAEKWYEMMLSTARAAAKEGQYTLAYQIASQVDDAYAPGTDVSARSLGERDDYTSLTWLAGTAALNQINRPADAIGMFTRYASGARSPQTIAKGLYWAGRAALAARKTGDANDFFKRAAAYPDQYYGQLAHERLDRRIVAPGGSGQQAVVSAADRTAFNARPIVRAAQLLGQQGAWLDQTKFVRAIAAQAETPQDHALAGELSRTMGRPDLGVMAGRRATASGVSGYERIAYPYMKVPESETANWTMIHAISRQESQFDRAIVSHAGARGLMQLMPATAKEQAGKVGLSYDMGSLFDPHYNVTLGSSYFSRLMTYYKGSYPLAVAAYNGGMGNVNKWLKANGDPREPGVDMVQWIENIPIYETRDYVQRVLENAVIYDLFNPQTSAQAASAKAPLSRYLGKSNPG